MFSPPSLYKSYTEGIENNIKRRYGMKLQNPTLVNNELYEKVEEMRVQKTLIKIFITIAIASVVFTVMTVIAS